jgi:hypothetical protein
MDKAAREYLSQIGRKGGQVKGASKSRGSDKARAAILARWAKAKQVSANKDGADVSAENSLK